AQFFAQAKKEMPDLMEQFKAGNFLGLREWLHEKIHKHGQRYRANDLCRKVTGETINHRPLMDYMHKKFGEIYGI
ncbi:MAG: carboxypeptidase M32, partial [Candidatus Zixiibacteriota bacterium]